GKLMDSTSKNEPLVSEIALRTENDVLRYENENSLRTIKWYDNTFSFRESKISEQKVNLQTRKRCFLSTRSRSTWPKKRKASINCDESFH
uniref:hypothetical protein n=1 Tax=Roseivirga sp. TaxID=1964215 RepID=UPI00404896A1